MKLRPPIEGKLAELTRYHGLRRARYRGLIKVGSAMLLHSDGSQRQAMDPLDPGEVETPDRRRDPGSGVEGKKEEGKGSKRG